MSLLTLIRDKLDPTDVIDILGLNIDEVVDICMDEIQDNISKFEYLEWED